MTTTYLWLKSREDDILQPHLLDLFHVSENLFIHFVLTIYHFIDRRAPGYFPYFWQQIKSGVVYPMFETVSETVKVSLKQKTADMIDDDMTMHEGMKE